MNPLKKMSRYESIKGFRKDIRKIKTELISKKQAKKVIQCYLLANETRKLQLGSGPTRLNGWLNTDIKSKPDCAYLDITEKFPIEDKTIDYIFTEHLIEHIPWEKGISMLKECRRILKSNGILRVATPDLEVFLKLYFQSSDVGKEYIVWITDRDLADVKNYRASFIINNLFQNYGHQFLYDEDLLVLALKEAGFSHIKRVMMGESEDKNLRNLESHGKDIGSEKMAAFETMVFEAR